MTHREIAERYADLPIDTSDPWLVAHLVKVAWYILPDIESEDAGKRMLAAAKLKDALKAVVPERPGDTVAANAMRRALRQNAGIDQQEGTT